MRTIWETCDDLTARLNTVNTELAAERALADDLAVRLAYYNDNSPALARWREAREPVPPRRSEGELAEERFRFAEEERREARYRKAREQ